jgi:hypothetical protein
VGPVSLGFTVNFGGAFSSVYINNNGNLTFGSSLSAYTPFPLSTSTMPIIAPFFADVDTRLTNPSRPAWSWAARAFSCWPPAPGDGEEAEQGLHQSVASG